MATLKSQSKPPEMSQDTGHIDNSSEPMPKKQKRKHTVLACESCHNNHLKCDGSDPCQQCIKRHTECHYTTPGKRGPKPGASSVLKSKLAQQEMSIQILTEELNRTKHEKEEWRQKYLAVVVSRQGESLIYPPQTISASPPENSTLVSYLEAYKTYVHPLYPIPASCDKLASLHLLNSNDPQHTLLSLQLYTVLAHGARMRRAQYDSNEFINSAKQKARNFFGDIESNSDLAYIFLLITYYYFGSGDLNKASYFNGIAYKWCQDLRILNSPVGRKSSSLLSTQPDDVENKDELLPKIHDIEPTTSELVWLTFMQIYTGFHSSKQVNPMSLLRKLEEVESITNKNSYSPFELLNLQALVSGCRAGVFWNAKVKDMARTQADKALELFREENFHFCSPFVIIPVALVLQIYLADKKTKGIQSVLAVLDRLSELYPLADSVRMKFTQFFDEVEQLLVEKKKEKTKQEESSTNNNLISQNQEIERDLKIQRLCESDLDLFLQFHNLSKSSVYIPWLIILEL